MRAGALAVLAAVIAASPVAGVEPGAASRVVEEIVVTAQKRAESVREVPVSMSVFDADFIRQEGITDYKDVSQYSPSTKIDVNSLFPDIRMRGFGSPLANKGFEQQVGLVLDGIPYGRDHYFQGPIFDVERVEVLRGPQGTLFGKNTTAGVFNVVTRNPTDEYTGSIDLELGEADRQRFEGSVGGPILKGLLNFRLAALSDTRDPYVENTTSRWVESAEGGGHGRDRKAVRAKLGLPDVLGANVVIGYEHVETELHGPGWEFFSDISPGLRNFFRQYDPDTDFVPNNYRGSVDAADYANVDIDTIVANVHYDLGDWSLDAVAGHSRMEFRAENDADFTPAPIFTTTPVKDDNPSTTFELRAASPTLPGLLGLRSLFGFDLGESDFLAGFFFQRRELVNSQLSIRIGVPALAGYLVAQGIPLSAVPGAPLGTGTLIPSGLFPGFVLGPDFRLGLIDPATAVEETSQYLDQRSDTFAGFTHLKWRFAPRWTIESGMRFTNETKDGTIRREFTEGTGLAAMLVAGMAEFSREASLSEFAFTPKVVLRYDWTDEIGLYAFWAEGFKAGGFNEQSSDGSSEGLVFGPEKATDFELGAKMTLLEQTAAVNLGLFRQTVTDLQVLTLEPPQLIARAVNAGEARSQGVELDAIWLPTDWLTVTGALGFIDAKFLEFPNGSCPQDSPNTDGDGQPLCDLADQPLARTPKWTTVLTPSVRWPLGRFAALPSFAEKLDLLGSLTVLWRDVQFLDENDDPRTRQKSHFRLNGTLGFGNTEQGWSAGVTVENLTDEETSARIRELTFGPGKFAQTLEPPRLVFGWARYTF